MRFFFWKMSFIASFNAYNSIDIIPPSSLVQKTTTTTTTTTKMITTSTTATTPLTAVKKTLKNLNLPQSGKSPSLAFVQRFRKLGPKPLPTVRFAYCHPAVADPTGAISNRLGKGSSEFDKCSCVPSR